MSKMHSYSRSIQNTVFQSVKFKPFNKVYTDRSVNLQKQELPVVYLLICALLLIYASFIFNRTGSNFEKFKFPVFLHFEKISFMLFPKIIFNFYF